VLQHVRTFTSPTTHGSTVEPSQNFYRHQQKKPQSVQEGLHRAARQLTCSCGFTLSRTSVLHALCKLWTIPYKTQTSIQVTSIHSDQDSAQELCQYTKIWRIPERSHSEKTAKQDIQCIHCNTLPVQSEWLSAYIKVNSTAINYSLGQK